MPVFYPASNPYADVRSGADAIPASGASRDAALGIVVCEREGALPFAESAFIRRLIRAGPRYGLDVFAFSPLSWREEQGTVRAWRWQSGWRREERPAPSLAYDRAWPEDAVRLRRHREALRRMTLPGGGMRLLNSRLPGKADVYLTLRRDPELHRRLPPTAPYRGIASVAAWLDRHGGAAFLKPSNGWQGRRVIVISRDAGTEDRVNLRGRTAANRPFRIAGVPKAEALARIDGWIGPRAYVMQPLLDLQDRDGAPFDVRVLMQRDGGGDWTAAGCAVRCGRQGGVTANLHGGGQPRQAERFLAELLGEARAADCLAELRRASLAVVKRLEETYGTFAELGLDFGIDRSGNCWFLEANSKPGRASIACAGGAAAAEAAERPLAYARHILLRSPWEGIS